MENKKYTYAEVQLMEEERKRREFENTGIGRTSNNRLSPFPHKILILSNPTSK